MTRLLAVVKCWIKILYVYFYVHNIMYSADYYIKYYIIRIIIIVKKAAKNNFIINIKSILVTFLMSFSGK